MSTITVDIWKRCEGPCSCKGISGNELTATTRTITYKNFGYCTHSAPAGRRIKRVTWKDQGLQRIGFLHEFENVESITTYYNTTYDGINNRINNPLLIRTKYGNKICWYENFGHYANKKWKKLGSEESKNFPKGGNHSAICQEFIDKLNKFTCILCGLHGIYIDETNGYQGICATCTQRIDVKFTKQPTGISGYYKHQYDRIPDNSVLVHKGTKLAYRRGLFNWNSYYVLIRLENKIRSVLVYYWDGDSLRENPLLIEVKRPNRTDWYENVSRPENGKLKHEKWKPLSYREETIPDLKERLDALNCIYNGTVQVKIGEASCHSPRYATLYKSRITSSYTQVIPGSLIYSYEYISTGDFSNQPFNVSEICMEDKIQKFEGDLPFRNVKKLTTYVSQCDNKKPFLICVEDTSNGYKWYERICDNEWKVYYSFGNDSPDKAKDHIEDIFWKLKTSLSIKECLFSSAIIQLDITQIPDAKNDTKVYTYDNTSIVVTKTENNPVNGFFGNLHKPIKIPFILKEGLGGGNNIRTGTRVKSISDVVSVYVYFWDGDINYEKPLIVEVKLENGETRYYSRSSTFSSWMHDMNKKKHIIPLLDHWNCKLNAAIPIELKKPEDLSSFHKNDSTLNCLSQIRYVTLDPKQEHPLQSNSDYVIKSCEMTENNTKISRLTYNNQPTDIVPPYTPISKLVIYRWKNSNNPLLVEFKPKTGDKSTWYENISKDGRNTRWKKIDEHISDEFYTKDHNTLTKRLTEKLNEVNCNVNRAIQIELDNKGKKAYYCHGGLHKHRVLVTPTSKDDQIDGLDGYDHTPINGDFHISSFQYHGDKQFFVYSGGKQHDRDFLKVKKVTVYFSACDDKNIPVLIYVLRENGSKKTLFIRVKRDDLWTEAESLKNQTPGKAKANDALNGVLTSVGSDLGIDCLKDPNRQGMIKAEWDENTVDEETRHASDDENEEEGDERYTQDNMFWSPFDGEDENKEFLRNEEKEDEVIKKDRAVYTLLRCNSTAPPVPPLSNPAPSQGEGDPSGSSGFTGDRGIPGAQDPQVPTDTNKGGDAPTEDKATVEAAKLAPTAAQPLASGDRVAPKKKSPDIMTPSIIASSVLGASGSITGFAYWIYQRFNGDPWVRQI